jgi:hypothetical protein
MAGDIRRDASICKRELAAQALRSSNDGLCTIDALVEEVQSCPYVEERNTWTASGTGAACG